MHQVAQPLIVILPCNVDFVSAHIGLLFSNMIVGLFYLFAGGDFGQTFGLGLLYFVLFTPVSFVCWFRPAYKAFRDDSSFNFMVFFFVFFFQFLMSILNFLGIGNTGSWYVGMNLLPAKLPICTI